MFVKTSFMAVCWVALAGFGYSQTKKSTPVKTMSAKPAASKPATAGKPRPADQTLLWEISGNGMAKPSYLFGTMHILCDKDATLSPNLKKAIKDVQVIYFELDMDDMNELMGAMKYLRMTDGRKLQDLISAAEYTRVEKYFKEHKTPLPLSFMTSFKPFFVSSLIGEQVMTCEGGKKNGMESKIMEENRQYAHEIKGLETAEYQAGLFDSIPYETQAKELVAYIDSIDTYKKATLEMVDVYRKQDLKRMDSLVVKSDPSMEKYMDLLLYDRNRKWVNIMPHIMGPNPVLFAVGAGHLTGDQGIISLLRKRGFTLKPLAN